MASNGAVAPSVWVQLYYEGQEEEIGEPFEIEPIPKNVSALKNDVIKVAKVMLGVQVYNLKVYAPGTTVPPPPDDASIRSWLPVPHGTGDRPLVVIAPKPQQQNGELCCCFVFLYSIVVRIRK
jgi:hypothetical protein